MRPFFWPGILNVAFLVVTARILKALDGVKCQNLTEIYSDFVSNSQRLLLNALFHTYIFLQSLNTGCMLSGKGTFVKTCG